MNAFTASDWTMYPFSSQNPKDFYNLMDVYTDAVFFPLLKEKSFQQFILGTARSRYDSSRSGF